jgi:hypothetical protein
MQSTINFVHMELRQEPEKALRKVAKALPAASTVDRIKSKHGAVFGKVFGNLTPNAFRGRQLGFANLLICKGCLVDLIGIEPMTSSMP